MTELFDDGTSSVFPSGNGFVSNVWANAKTARIRRQDLQKAAFLGT